MDTEPFRELSESVEKWLAELGTDWRDESTGEAVRQCSGESLYNICAEFRFISQTLSDQSLSDAIITAVGDRTTKYIGTLGDCWGVTSHDAAGTVVYNIGYHSCRKVWNAIRKPAGGMWPQWKELTAALQRKVAAIERKECPPASGLSELVSAVRTERILYLKTQKSDWKPTSSASTVDRQRLEFYNESKAKDATLRYKKIAAMWCQKHPGDMCDEGAFRQSCHRARKKV